jgi:ribose transport system substrate-binding protein
MSKSRWQGTPAAVALAAVAACALVAGCSGADSGGNSSSASAGGATQSSTAASSAGTPSLADLEKGVFGSVPTSAPKATKQTVWVVSCGQQSVGCADEAGGAMTAGATLGWNMHLCDGKFDTDGAWDSCIRQSISAKATGIILDGIDCGAVKQPLVEAKTAGIKTTTTHDFDCDDPSVGGSPLLSTNVQFLPDALSAADYWTAVGKAGADYLIAQTNGHALVLDLTFPEVTYVSYLDKGLKAEIAACSDCKIVDTLELSVQDQATNQVPTKLSSALLKDTSANALYVPFESLFPFGVKQAIVSSGRGSQLTVLGGEGEPANLSYIKSGQPGENGVIATSESWCGWASVDELNRAFAGQPAVPEGIGYQLVTNNNVIVDSKGRYKPPIDYQSAYKAAWGV